ncbi:glycosyltransferase family 2 protein [Cohnella fermenti]|uniref:glycosyltransferase family 2 protein n=1 Tax=Cohnella fermenti TaxID=2565925 RepID=UPI001454DA2A|nr:glycosyltransferase family A protein [Cohnella fermenti]
MEGKISVIIPMYNTEEYVAKCIDSVLSQTYTNFEIIVIDDGSTDECANIVKQYASNDNRIYLYSQKNSGPSVARNYGLDVAGGEYIYFLDSDDYIDVGTFEKCMIEFRNNRELDMIMFDAQTIFEERFLSKEEVNKNYLEDMNDFYNRSDVDTNSIVTPYEWFRACFAISKLRCNSYLYMFKREQVTTNSIRFRANINYYEDLIFLYELSRQISKIKYIPAPFYYRRFTGSSLMTSNNYNKILESILLCIDTIRTTEMHKYQGILVKRIFLKYLNTLALGSWMKCNDQERIESSLQDILDIKFRSIQGYVNKRIEIENQYLSQINILESAIKGDINEHSYIWNR